MAGFIADVKAWQILASSDIPQLEYKYAFISTGKFVFSKYIPGKLWVIIGKAGYLKEKYNRNFLDLTSLSLYYQLVAIWTGTLTGCAILYRIDKQWFLLSIVIVLSMFLISVIFYHTILNITSKILSWVLKKEFKFPLVPFKKNLLLTLFSLLNWIMWALAFYIFLLSMEPLSKIPIAAGMLFPLSSVVGIIVIIAPGGLGFREGFMTLGLTVLGMTAKDAASIALLSRLWVLIGELFIFLFAFILDWNNKKRLKLL